MTFIQLPRLKTAIKAVAKELPASRPKKETSATPPIASKYWQRRTAKWETVKAKLEAMPALLQEWRERRASERETLKSKKRPF
jgi:hypothetical protein